MEAPPTALDLILRIAEELPVGVWAARVPDGNLAYANRAFKAIMGMEARGDVAAGEYSEPYGIFGLDGLPYPEQRMPFVQAMMQRTSVTLDDIVIHRHDGGRVNIRAWAQPLFSDAGELTHVVIAFSDITEQVLAEGARAESEERLHRSRRMESIGKLAGGIAHDFNNLLAAIRVVAGSLYRTAEDTARRDDLQQILDATERAVGLTRSLLGFAGGGRNLSQSVDLHKLVESMAGLFRRTLDSRIHVSIELDAKAGVVVGDVAQLEQVFMNLVLNARDVLPTGGKIKVRTEDVTLAEGEGGSLPAGAYVRLSVEDTGPGVPAELRERIFEPYFTTKVDGAVQGTGLGLATVYGIADSHGGRVTVEAGAGGGARFVVLLPATTRQRSGPHAVATDPQLGAGTILVVDDEELVRTSTARALRSLGFEVLTAPTGIEAVELHSRYGEEITGVVLDMVMPDMDGRTTLRALRAAGCSATVVLTTGFSLNEEAQQILDEGADAFLTKPYDLGRLSELLSASR